MRIETEVFFRPEVVKRAPSSIQAGLYAQCLRALNRSTTGCAFVPVRSMQVLAVITGKEIIFVDSLNYRVCDGRGGRLIMLAWGFSGSSGREHLNDPVTVEILHYHPESGQLHGRLMSEFGPALDRQQDIEMGLAGKERLAKVISLYSKQSD